MSIFDAVEDFWEMIKSIPGAMVDIAEGVVNVVGDVVKAVAGAASEAVSKVWDVFTESPQCLLFAGSPAYWKLVSELTTLRETGVIKESQRDEIIEKIGDYFIDITNIPGYKMFWNCAWKMAFSKAGVTATVVTTGAVATRALGLSTEDQVTGLVSAVCWGNKRLDLLARGMDNGVYHKCYNQKDGWYPGDGKWSCLGGQIQQPPTIVSWGKDRLDLFVCGSDRSLWHKCYDGSSGWYPSELGWNSLGGQLLGGPSVVSWSPGILNVVVRGLDNGIHYKGFDGTNWTGWAALGGQTQSAPRIVSWGPGRLDIFVRGLDNCCHHIAYDATSGWSTWENLGGNITGTPAAVAWGPNRLDIVVRGSDGAAWHKCWNPGAYYPPGNGWSSLGGNITDTPSIVSWGPGCLDMVARGTDGAVWHKSYKEGKGWDPSETEWRSLGGNIEGSPTIVSWGKGILNIVARGTAKNIHQTETHTSSKNHVKVPVTKHPSMGKPVIYKGYNEKSGWYPSLTEWSPLGGDTK